MLFGTVLWASAFTAVAAGAGAVQKQVEMTMLVTGTVDIQTDGSVIAHALDQAEALPGGVVKLVGGVVPSWRFEPLLVDGKPVKARARMTLRMVARQQEDGNYSVGIRSTSFGAEGGVAGEDLTAAELAPPKYPEQAFRSNVSGTVYLVLRVGRQGVVEDLVAEQVNLTALGSELQMKRARELLSRAALLQAKSWTFHPPTRGKEADAPYWSVRVPVDFSFEDQSTAKYGQWQAYVPGPQQQPTWVHDLATSGSPDAFAAGGLHQLGKGPRLLTPPDQG